MYMYVSMYACMYVLCMYVLCMYNMYMYVYMYVFSACSISVH